MKENKDKMWLPIDNFPDYEISNKGEVINIRSGRRLKPYIRGCYKTIRLCHNKVQRQESVHVLVAEAHVPNPNWLKLVNHVDEDKLNNDSTNLEWSTVQKNTEHSLSTWVKLADKAGNVIHIFNLSKFARDNNLDGSNLHAVVSGRAKSSKGYRRVLA